jgi:signal transduction histidine kinase
MIGERPYHFLVAEQPSEQSAQIVICIASPLENWSTEELLNALLSETLAPLSSIKGFTELLRREIGGTITTRQQDFLNAIAKHTDQLLSLRSDVLMHARHIQRDQKERQT